jgi:hypothetical protein
MKRQRYERARLPYPTPESKYPPEAGSDPEPVADNGRRPSFIRSGESEASGSKQSPSAGAYCCCEEAAPRHIRDISNRPEV